MNIQQCKYVLTVAERGSFREASRALFMAQSSLSQSIKELEEEYGITIFLRSNRGVVITSEGAEFIEYAQRIVASAEIMDDRYLRNSNKRKTFSISNIHLQYVNRAFIDLLAKQSFDNLNFRLIERSISQVISDVQTSFSELGFLYITSNNRKALKQAFLERELDFFPIIEYQNHVIMNKLHPLATSKVLDAESIAPYQLATIENPITNEVNVPLKDTWTSPDQTMVFIDSVSMFYELLQSNYTLGLGSYLYLNELPENLTRVRIKHKDLATIGYIRSKRMRVTEMEELFLKGLKAELAKLDANNDFFTIL